MKRITLFSGHYGSGKTNASVNFAVSLAKSGKKVSVYDMDIVNPYYRTLDAKDRLNAEGVHLVVSGFANSNVDLPSVSAESYAMIHDKSRYAVVDIGGDDRGALVLGRFSEEIKAENDYEFIYVLNKFRPETRDIESAFQVFNEIENACKIKFTAIMSNGNLGKETTKSDVLEGLEFSKEFAKKVGLPVKYTGVWGELLDKENFDINNILRLDLINYLKF